MHSLKTLYSAGFALGALSLIVFSLGHIGLISPPFLIASIVISIVLFSFFLKKLPSDDDRPERVPLWHIAAMAGLTAAILPLALMPPSVRDELIQHLALPSLYARNGSIIEVPFMGFSYLPQNIALLYLIPIGLGSDIAPRLMHLGFSVLTALSIYQFIRPKAGANLALLGFAAYLATPVVLNLSRMAYVDGGAVFFSTLSLIAALRFHENNGKGWLIYSALSMGFALGAKYTILPAFLFIGAFIAWSACKKSGRSAEGMKSGVIYALLALALLSPWLARNALWKGNPFYPLYQPAPASAASVGKTPSPGAMQLSENMAPIAKRLVLYNEGAFDVALIPLRIFFEGKDNSIERFDGVFNPVYLFLIPLAFFIRKDRDAKWLGLFASLFFLTALLTVDLVIRYLLPAVPAVVILVVLGFRNLKEVRGLRPLIVTFVMAIFAYDALYTWGLYKAHRPFDYISGKVTRAGYLEAVLPDYKAVSYANSHLPQSARVMLLLAGERGYYWERDYFYTDRAGTTIKAIIRDGGGATGFKSAMEGRGVTHLFINDKVMSGFVNNNLDGSERAVLVDFFRDHAELLHSSNGFSIYRII